MTLDRQYSVAVGGSLGLHLIAVLIAILLLLWRGYAVFQSPDPADPVPEEREITMLIPEKIILEARPEKKRFVESRDDQGLDSAPNNSKFESDANTKAAGSSDPTNDDKSISAQEGRDAANIELANQKPATGAIEPAPETVLDPADTMTQEPVIGDTPDESIPAPREKESTTQAQEKEKLIKSKQDGGADNTSATAAVDAEATPAGRFQKVVKSALISQSKAISKKRGREPNAGIVKVRFKLRPDSTVYDVEFVEIDADAYTKNQALDSVLDATIPEWPPELKEALGDSPFIMEYEFVFGN